VKTQKHNGRPPSNRKPTFHRNPAPGLRPIPLMSIKTRPPTHTTMYPSIHPSFNPLFHHPPPFNHFMGTQSLLSPHNLPLPIHPSLQYTLPSHPPFHSFPSPIFTY
jgi:hypothetical protein